MFDIGVLIFVEYHAWVHDILWVKQFFHLAHQLVSILAPLATNEWRHVATCTVFGLQTAVVFVHHQVHHCTHHAVVLRNGLCRVKALVQDKVVVALQRVTINHGIWVVMLDKQLLQIQCCLCQVLDREGYIFNQTGRAYLASTSYCWEYTAAHRPVFACHSLIRGEGGWLAQIVAA